jgi:hypothetical protein
MGPKPQRERKIGITELDSVCKSKPKIMHFKSGSHGIYFNTARVGVDNERIDLARVE